jgi:hypothetical protein
MTGCTIPYPYEGRHTTAFGINRAQALGRNGVMYATGVRIFSTGSTVVISPVHTRGPGRCWIEIPSDPATLNQIADQLRAIAKEAVAA